MALYEEVWGLVNADEITADLALRCLPVCDVLAETADGWDVARALLQAMRVSATLEDHLIAGVYLLYTEHERAGIIRAIQQGARIEELMALRVSPTMVVGSDLQSISTTGLHERMRTVQWLRSLGQPSPWLAKYAGLLTKESRRRRGIVEG